MTFGRIAIGALVGLAGIFATVATRAQEPTRPDQLVGALNGVFGKHPGDRAAHMTEQPVLNTGKEWSKKDLFSLRNRIEIATFLMRTETEVREKAAELGIELK